MESGIYTITNLESGRVYVGSAVNLKGRWVDHRKMLRGNRHRNPYLQAAWNKYGESVFKFQPILYCDKPFLIIWEQVAIDGHKSTCGWNNMYNFSPTAGSQLGSRRSAASRARMSAAQKGRPPRHTTPHSEESKRKMAETHSNMSVQTKQKMSTAKLGKKRKPFTDETLRRMSEAHRGQLVSEETRRKWSEARKGKPWPLARRDAQTQKQLLKGK